MKTLLTQPADTESAGCIGADRAYGKPIVLKTMGSLFFGGTVARTENNETFHGDHAYAQYYIPQESRRLPIVLWHGMGQSGKTFESTSDGREGFQAILTRRSWSVYIIDQPGRGRAGRTQRAAPESLTPTSASESGAWNTFRLGIWNAPEGPRFFSHTQFPRGAASVEQFLRQQTPDTGEELRTPEFRKFMGQTVADLFQHTGPGILVTHSFSGQYGWYTGMTAPELVRGIVAYEPSAFVFPESACPTDRLSETPGVAEAMRAQAVPDAEFAKLTTMPLMVVFGDHIPNVQSDIFCVDIWRVARLRARQFVDEINRRGGDAQLVLLPDIGIKGNSHFLFADLNNLEIADHLETFLASKNLDGQNPPHNGPHFQQPETYTVPLNPMKHHG